MKRFFIALLAVLTLGLTARADEGMWLLPYLQKINYADMKANGLKLSATDIYNPNGSSLMDAIVIFGGGCTGEIVSPDGLIFTNHHCGYGSIQALSSVEHDYLNDGFWAMNRAEEIPAPGLSITFIRSMENITAEIVKDIPENYTEQQRNEIIANNVKAYNALLREQNPGKTARVESFFGGNEFFAIVSEIFRDVRLVGTPPSSIGKYGGDTDNWMWPRHTGDFSIFRVYSAPDGSPAAYSPDNVPYSTPKHLKISAQGYKEGDFAMVMGFPGSTQRYMTTYEIDEFLDISAPNRIFIRGERQDIIWKDMEASEKVRIQYASKYAGSSNYWKNSIGMSKALKKLKIRDKKEAEERAFQAWATADPSRARYATALPLIAESAEGAAVTGHAQILAETILTPFEIARIAASASRGLAKIDEMTPEQLERISDNLYKNYNEPTERKVAKRMLEIAMEMLPADVYPEFINTDVIGKFGGDVNRYVDWVFDNSVFATKESFDAFLADFDAEKMAADPAMPIYSSTVEKYYGLFDSRSDADVKFDEGHRLYVAGLLEMNPDAKYYPDANFTMRLTYGTIEPYSPADAVDYSYYTTLKGVIEKEDTSNPLEFTVPDKLKQLYETGDYGRYADYTGLTKKEIKNGAKGHLNTCFISTNDITGGNSGSPVLNGRGELIGLAFDGNWEAMSGDIVFEPELQRCINVDVRYVLWTIDKFAGAGHLLDEMTIVW